MEPSWIKPLFNFFWYGFIIILGCLAAVYDIKFRRIPNKIIFFALGSWVVAITIKGFLFGEALTAMADSLFGLLSGGGLFLFVALISKNGVGGGDVKLMGVIGLFMGFYGSLHVAFYSVAAAALTLIPLIAAKKIRPNGSMPFAPFLLIGMIIHLFSFKVD